MPKLADYLLQTAAGLLKVVHKVPFHKTECSLLLVLQSVKISRQWPLSPVDYQTQA